VKTDPPDATPRPLEIVWSPVALARLREIRAYVAASKPDAAERLAARMVAVIEALRHHPYLGHSGNLAGTRELVIGGTPYFILYRVADEHVVIQTIWHGAQRDR
jgi:toxin ParE1/3/4